MAAGTLNDRLAAARAQLMRIPGVVGVGWGYKERAGVVTRKASLRVYVHQKKPLEDVPPEEVIPPEVCGLRTDVLVKIVVDETSCVSLTTRSPLVGGNHVSNMHDWELSGRESVVPGTLGFFATKNRETSRDRYVLLSCQHVLGLAGGGVGDTIYQPHLRLQPAVDGGDDLRIPVNPREWNAIAKIEDIGTIDNVRFTYPGEAEDGYFVDCATAKIDTCYSSWCDTNCGKSLTNKIEGLQIDGRDSIVGVGRVTNDDIADDRPPYKVWKVGHTTGRTVGDVTAVAEPIPIEGTDRTRENCIVIANTGPNCEDGGLFAWYGDSGSVIVNRERKIVGLLFAKSRRDAGGVASHIAPVTAHLGITMISADNRIRGNGSGTALRTDAGAPPDVARAVALRSKVLESARGRAATALVERHRAEIGFLVNHVRQVTVAWHRVHGPEFLGHVLEASRSAAHRVPREVDGVSRAEAAARMLERLDRFGSASLKADIERHGDEMRALLDAADDVEGLARAVDDPVDAPAEESRL